MTRRLLGWVALLLIGSGPLFGEAVTSSPRPLPRPVMAAAPETVRVAVPVAVPMVRPRPRPALFAAAPQPKKKTKAARAGSVCGDPDIKGTEIPQVTSKTKGCGIADPVKVTEVAGLRLSQPATIDCETAAALKTWVIKGMRPAFGNREVVQLNIFGSYSCRARNNVRGAKVSEHGRGRAVDIAGFVFANGQEWTIQRDYNKTIRQAQKAACGIFGTTLGPGSDGYHEDHLHFDTAKHRNGSYCR